MKLMTISPFETNQPLGDPHEDDDENSDNGSFNEDELEVCDECGYYTDECCCDGEDIEDDDGDDE